jgi:hypothetical protein
MLATELDDDADAAAATVAKQAVPTSAAGAADLAERLLGGGTLKLAGSVATTEALLRAASAALRRRLGSAVGEGSGRVPTSAAMEGPASLLFAGVDGELTAADSGDLIDAGAGMTEVCHRAERKVADMAAEFAGEFVDPQSKRLRGRPVFVRAAARLPSGEWSDTVTIQYRLLTPLERFFEALPIELRRYRGRLLAFGLTDLDRLVSQPRLRLRRAFARLGVPRDDATGIIRALRAEQRSRTDAKDGRDRRPVPRHLRRASLGAVGDSDDERDPDDFEDDDERPDEQDQADE